MKTIGLIGGTGPGTTVRYYEGLIEQARQRLSEGHLPEIIIDSMDCARLFDLVHNRQTDGMVEFLTAKVTAVARAGAQCAAFAGMTAHLVFKEVAAASPLPLIHIASGCAEKAQLNGFHRVGLIGGAAAMQNDFAALPFLEKGMDVIVPNLQEQHFIIDVSENEIEHGFRRPETLEAFCRITERMHRESAIDALYLANTDLGAFFADTPLPVPTLDPVPLHIAALVKESLS